MTAFRPFTKEDWYGMAGAAPFEDGSEPLVCYDIKVDDLDTIAVIDAEGFHFEVLTPDGETISALHYERDLDAMSAPAVFRFLATMDAHYDNGAFHYTTGELADMGMEPVRQ